MLGPALSHWSTALNYLQSEALRFELERSGWEKERFEFKKRIVQLEKEVEMQQRLHHDNLLRIKMLEFALQQERRPQGEKVGGRSGKPSVVSVSSSSPALSPGEKDKATALLDGPHALFSAESREKRKTNLTTWVDNFEKLADDILHQMNASPQVNGAGGGKPSTGGPAVNGSFISTRYSSFSSSSSSSSSSGSFPFDDPKNSSSSSSASSASSLDSSAGAAQGSSWNRSRKKISMRDLSSFSENKSTTSSSTPSSSSSSNSTTSSQPPLDSTKSSDQEAPSSPPMGNGPNSNNSSTRPNNSTRPSVPVLASLSSKTISTNQSQAQVQSPKPQAKPSEDDGWDSIDFSPRQYHKDSILSSSPPSSSPSQPSSSSSTPKSPSTVRSQNDQEDSWDDLSQKPPPTQSSESNGPQASPRKASEPVEMPQKSTGPTGPNTSSPPGHQPAPQSPRKTEGKVQSPRKGSSPPSSSSSSSSSGSALSPGVVRSESKGDLKSAESSTVSELKNLAQSLMQNSDPVDDSPESSDRINLSWSPIYTLRAHLDSVRSFSFHGTQPVMISASEDYTVKVWSLQNLNKTKIDVECIHTYFGHTGPVYTCALDADTNWAFSGGADGKVMHWKLPSSLTSPPPLDPFQSYGRALSLLVSSLDFHSDAVWDLAFHPRHLLFSSSSDGSVALWDLNPDPSSSSSSSRPKRVIEYESGEGVKDKRVVPTSISVSGTDNNHLLVGYNSSALHLVDIETGKTISRMDPSSSPSEGELSSSSYRGPHVPDPSSQINKVVSHHMIPIAITAHEDRFIRYFDTRSGQCIHSMVGHLDSVSSLSIDPSGLFLLSGGHDSSIRMWDIGSKNCVKEFTGNRKKFDEAVNCVAHHPTLGLCASAGADSTIKFLKKRPL